MEILDTIIGKIKKHKLICFLIIVCTFLLPLLIIHFLYSPPSFFPSVQTNWSAGDLLGYYASFVSTLGTIALSLVAIMLSYMIAKAENEREEKKRVDDITVATAILSLKEINYYSSTFDIVFGKKEEYDILLIISNNSINVATDVQIINPILLLKNESNPINLVFDKENKNYIDGKDEVRFYIRYGKLKQSESKLTFTLYYKDSYLIHVTDYEALYANDVWDINKIYEHTPELITIKYSSSNSNQTNQQQ
jgi:hypothetical protein